MNRLLFRLAIASLVISLTTGPAAAGPMVGLGGSSAADGVTVAIQKSPQMAAAGSKTARRCSGEYASVADGSMEMTAKCVSGQTLVLRFDNKPGGLANLVFSDEPDKTYSLRLEHSSPPIKGPDIDWGKFPPDYLTPKHHGTPPFGSPATSAGAPISVPIEVGPTR